MSTSDNLSRRSFMAISAAGALAAAARGSDRKVPVGLELYSVREDLKRDEMGTVRAVAKQGYQVVEFYSPYYQWTTAYANDMRKLLDDLGVRCLSTHNDLKNLKPEGIDKAIELNKIIGAKYVVVASAGAPKTLDAWKGVAEALSTANGKLQSAGLHAGYHNHQLEFRPLEGKRPIEVIAANTPKDVLLQLDVGTCIEAGSDPVAWINANPGRIRCIHCKDWSPEKGYHVLFGDGAAPWPKIFDAAEKTGGIEYYLIEQEGYSMPELETVQQCLANFRKIRAA